MRVEVWQAVVARVVMRVVVMMTVVVMGRVATLAMKMVVETVVT